MAKRRKKAKRKAKRKVKKRKTKKRSTRKKAKRGKKKTKKRKTTKRKAKKKTAKRSTKRRGTKRKAKKKAKKKKRGKRKPPAAFMAPLRPSPALAKIVGSKPLPRTQVVKKIWQYIKRRKLQDKKNRRNINCDATMKDVFKKNKVSMFEMNKLLKRHLKK